MSGENSSSLSGEVRYLAHEKARPGQLEMIHDCLGALSSRGYHLAAAPTGIGKTAAALSAAIEVARSVAVPKKILFLTSRQSQHKIVVDTVRKLNRRLKENLRPVTVVDIIGRESMCEVVDIQTGRCLCEQGSSEGSRARSKEDLRGFLLREPRHVYETVQHAKISSVCAWQVCRSTVKDCDVLVCDYNHLFDDRIREGSLSSMGITLQDSIIVVDEAHNLPDRIRMGMERRFTPTVIRNAGIDLEEYSETLAETTSALATDGPMQRASLATWALHVMKACRRGFSEFFRELLNEPAEFDERQVDMVRIRHIFMQACDEVEGKIGQQKLDSEPAHFIDPPATGLKRLNILRDVLLEVEIKIENDEDTNNDIDAHRIGQLLDDMLRFGETSALVYVHDAKGKEGRITSHLLDPGLVSGPVFQRCSGSILMSGTLYPPTMYADLLGIGQEKTTSRQYESPFANQRRPIIVAKDVTTRYQERSYENTLRIRSHLQALCDASPGHVAVFTPSYSMLNDYIGEGHFKGVILRMEDRTWSKNDVDQILDVLEREKKAGRRVLLAGVFGGRLSEGIDYRNGLLDAVACIGIPNPPPSIHQKSLRTYIEERFGRANAWRYASTQPAINSILQAMGRPIRSIADRALILLLDKRNTDRTYIGCYPRDIRMNTTTEPETTKSFARRFFSRVHRQSEGSS